MIKSKKLLTKLLVISLITTQTLSVSASSLGTSNTLDDDVYYITKDVEDEDNFRKGKYEKVVPATDFLTSEITASNFKITLDEIAEFTDTLIGKDYDQKKIAVEAFVVNKAEATALAHDGNTTIEGETLEVYFKNTFDFEDFLEAKPGILEVGLVTGGQTTGGNGITTHGTKTIYLDVVIGGGNEVVDEDASKIIGARGFVIDSAGVGSLTAANIKEMSFAHARSYNNSNVLDFNAESDLTNTIVVNIEDLAALNTISLGSNLKATQTVRLSLPSGPQRTITVTVVDKISDRVAISENNDAYMIAKDFTDTVANVTAAIENDDTFNTWIRGRSEIVARDVQRSEDLSALITAAKTNIPTTPVVGGPHVVPVTLTSDLFASSPVTMNPQLTIANYPDIDLNADNFDIALYDLEKLARLKETNETAVIEEIVNRANVSASVVNNPSETPIILIENLEDFLAIDSVMKDFELEITTKNETVSGMPVTPPTSETVKVNIIIGGDNNYNTNSQGYILGANGFIIDHSQLSALTKTILLNESNAFAFDQNDISLLDDINVNDDDFLELKNVNFSNNEHYVTREVRLTVDNVSDLSHNIDVVVINDNVASENRSITLSDNGEIYIASDNTFTVNKSELERATQNSNRDRFIIDEANAYTRDVRRNVEVPVIVSESNDFSINSHNSNISFSSDTRDGNIDRRSQMEILDDTPTPPTPGPTPPTPGPTPPSSGGGTGSWRVPGGAAVPNVPGSNQTPVQPIQPPTNIPVPLPITRHEVEMQIGSTAKLVNGDVQNMDVAPYIENGRTMVPVRFLANALSVPESNIHWDGEQRLVTIIDGSNTIEIIVDEDVMHLNGNPINLDQSAQITNDRVFVPIRPIAEALGAEVNWDEATQTVTLSRKV